MLHPSFESEHQNLPAAASTIANQSNTNLAPSSLPHPWLTQKITPMLKNYLTVAWRNMRNNKVYSALNIVGLAMGMAVALLIGLWVVNQYAYDRFLPNYEQAYQVRFSYTDQRKG